MTYRYIGKDTIIHDAVGKATGSLKYCGDIQDQNMLHMKLLMSPIAHGRIIKIDSSEAEKLPGVVSVLTHYNTPDRKFDRGRVLAYEDVLYQESLFTDRVRFAGERVAAVIAETTDIASEAIQKIKVEYEELHHAITVEEALKPESEKINKDGNCYELDFAQIGNYKKTEYDLEMSSNISIQRVTHLAMETHSCVAYYDNTNNKLTIYSPCQSVFAIRSTIADLLDMPYVKVRVVKTTMGGSFGCKQETMLEPLAAYAAKLTGRPVKLVYSREEVIKCTVLKHPMKINIESKVEKDGKINGLKIDATLDAGAYATISPGYAHAMRMKLNRAYDIDNLDYHARIVLTNTPCSGSFRSWSTPELYSALENHINLLADKMNLDPVELRLKNIMKPNSVDRLSKESLGEVRLAECLLQGREAFLWQERRGRLVREIQTTRFRKGIGVALAAHVNGFYPKKSDLAALSLRLQEDGSVGANICIHDHGCGTVTLFRNLIGEVLDIDTSLIDIAEGDTDKNLYDYGCYSSRGTYVLGKGVVEGAEKLLAKVKSIAAIMLGVSPVQIKMENGMFFGVKNAQEKLSYREICQYSLRVLEEDVVIVHQYASVSNPGVGGAHFAEVEVDTYTGIIKVTDYLAVHDIGRALNPIMCRTQIEGAIQQGMGIALSEIIRINEKTGEVIDNGLKNYVFVNAYDMPKPKVIFVEEGENKGPFNAKSVGEVAVSPVTPVIMAAINNALGTSLNELPLSPDKILKALAK